MEEGPPQVDKSVEATIQVVVAAPSPSPDDACVDGRARASGQEEFTCSLYISRAVGPQGQVQGTQGGELLRCNLEEVIRSSDPLAAWHVSETPCGLIAAFACEADAEKLLQRGDLARVFEGPVQVARFSAKDSRYRQAVLLRDVPWAIPLQDINSALSKQGIATGSVERWRQYIRVEIALYGAPLQVVYIDSGAGRRPLRAAATSRLGLLWRRAVQRDSGALVARRCGKQRWTAAAGPWDGQQLPRGGQLPNGRRGSPVLQVSGLLAHGCELQAPASLRSMRGTTQRRVLSAASEQSNLLPLFRPSSRWLPAVSSSPATFERDAHQHHAEHDSDRESVPDERRVQDERLVPRTTAPEIEPVLTKRTKNAAKPTVLPRARLSLYH